MMFKATILQSIMLLLPAPVFAATIEVTAAGGGKTPIISIYGEIVTGDELKFGSIASANPQAIVDLNSNGGSIQPAMEIGKVIKLREYTTVVYKNDTCASACALIWLAGNRKIIFSNGKVGFHASYKDVDGRLIEVGMGNALVGHYLSQIGYDQKAVIFATEAPPENILWLNAGTAPISGISYETIALSDKDDSENSFENVTTPPPPITFSQSDGMASAPTTSRNVKFFVNGLLQLGYKANFDNSDSTSPKIFTGVDGNKFEIAFSGCENFYCKYAELIGMWTAVSQQQGNAAVLKYGMDESFANVIYQKDSKNLAVYHYIVLGSDGITLQNMIDNMNYFSKEFSRVESVSKN